MSTAVTVAALADAVAVATGVRVREPPLVVVKRELDRVPAPGRQRQAVRA